MFCEKCGSQFKDNSKFCSKCGNQIYHAYAVPTIQTKNDKQKSKKPLVTTLLIVLALAILGTIIGITVSSCNKKKGLADLLTSHVWKNKDKNEILNFNKDGTYTITYTNKNDTDKHNWSINGKELKLNYQYSGTYSFRENVTDKDIDNDLLDDKDYTWYVSDKYLIICEDDSDSSYPTTVFYAQDIQQSNDSNESLTSLLTGHDWSDSIMEYDDQYKVTFIGIAKIKFHADGSYTVYKYSDESLSTTQKGYWTLKNKVLQLDGLFVGTYTYLEQFKENEEDRDYGMDDSSWYITEDELVFGKLKEGSSSIAKTISRPHFKAK